VENQSLKEVLSKYIPADAVAICADWIVHLNIHLRITKSRASKYGDYRPHPDKNGHIITVNHDLNQYSFLLTFIHEVAHLNCQKKYSRFAMPHGKEWKHEFSTLLKFFLTKDIFPSDVRHAIHHYMHDPAASSCTDEHLSRTLKKYNKGENTLHLEELPRDAVFRLQSDARKLLLKKGERMRKNFRCYSIDSKKEYWVNPLAEVIEETKADDQT
jgi:SprT protein